MELLLSQPHFSRALLLLLLSNLLLWEKAASIPACQAKKGGCWDPLVETFNSAIQRAETLQKLSNQFYVELYHNEFSSGQFAALVEDYLKTLINYVGSWISPLFHLVIELSAMQDVPETILSKAKEIELKNREILGDLRWILTKVYPKAKTKEEFSSWEHLSFLKSSNKNNKFLAMFNLSNCLEYDTQFTLFHLRLLKCRITLEDC
ncbi:prolactin-8A8-like isoform X4 [Arvicanthis niloticus]|uniref:prolactin-8A8-like isoform X4 n=1 Tax=Arvicanthis niloticus TaxID=61156 RepID=UPI001486B791|nr:prolactin-8A8-like isoform X4 [Arvicanthis niloticus]